MDTLPSGSYAHPSKMGCRLCPELNLKPYGSGFPCAPARCGVASTSERAAAASPHRHQYEIRTFMAAYGCCRSVVVLGCCAVLRAASSALYSASVRSYQPIQEKPISSIVRPVPAPTQFFGSGLYLLAAVLSNQLMTCSKVPAGTIGATSSS